METSQTTLFSALKECARARDLTRGRNLHNLIIQTRLDSNTYLASSLVTMYSKCSQMKEAQKVFDSMKSHDVVAWTSLMLGYAENWQGILALDLLTKMVAQGCIPDARTLVAALKACISLAMQETSFPKLQALEKAMFLHSQTHLVFDWDIYAESTLVDLYAKSGSMIDAQRAFDSMARHDVVSWTALMLGYAESHQEEKAFQAFEWMLCEGCRPNARTFVVVLKACTRLARVIFQGTRKVAENTRQVVPRPLEIGMALHSLAAKYNCESLVTDTLIEMYAACGCLDHASKVFNNVLHPSEVSWNVLMLGYVEHGEPFKALKLFEQMGAFQPYYSMVNAANLLAALKACTAMENEEELVKLETCMLIHSLAVSRSLEQDPVLASTLLDAYTKCGSLGDGERVFYRMKTRDVVSWTSLMSGYVENGQGGYALKLFFEMKDQGIPPDTPTYATVLRACGSETSLKYGAEVHGDVSVE